MRLFFFSSFQLCRIFCAKECTKISTTEEMFRVGDFGVFPLKCFMHFFVFVRKPFEPLTPHYLGSTGLFQHYIVFNSKIKLAVLLLQWFHLKTKVLIISNLLRHSKEDEKWQLSIWATSVLQEISREGILRSL